MDKIADDTQFAFPYLRIFFCQMKLKHNTAHGDDGRAFCFFFVLYSHKKVSDFTITHTPTSNAKGEGLSCVLSAVCLFAFGILFSFQHKKMPRLY